MTNYLVRTEQTGAAPSQLLHFTHDEGAWGLPAEANLIEYLSHLIRLNTYTGIGPLVKGMWRWNDDDSRTVLELRHLKDVPEMDRVDQYYEVRGKGTDEVITSFTVRI